MLDKDFIYKKISLIQEELAHLSELADFTLDEVASDFYKFNTLERLLEKIITRAIDVNQHLLLEYATKDTKIPKTYKETFSELSGIGVYSEEFGEEISKSVGTRNKLVHEYDDEKFDYKNIYTSIDDCLKDYHKYCEYVLKFIENKS